MRLVYKGRGVLVGETTENPDVWGMCSELESKSKLLLVDALLLFLTGDFLDDSQFLKGDFSDSFGSFFFFGLAVISFAS
jgi:hypothetical protein